MENATNNTDLNWTLDVGLNGPAIASVVALHFLFALPTNLFVVVHSLCHTEGLKKSASILLFNLALSNLVIVVFYMPFTIVASAAGEWIVGLSDNSRHVLCQIHGFIFEYSVNINCHILVVIAVDRFLYIVKAQSHQKLMSRKVTLGIVAAIWICPLFWCLLPFYGSGVGVYEWSESSGGCLSFILHDSLALTIFYIFYASLLVIIIVVATMWTFMFTHGFLKKMLQRQKEIYSSGVDMHVYHQKIRNLFGIFGVLLAVNLFSWFSYVFPPVFFSIMGDRIRSVPVEITATLFIFAFLNTVVNPVLQMYFRQEIRKTVTRMSLVVTTLLNTVLRKFSKEKEEL